MVEIPDVLFGLAIIAMFAILIDNIHRHWMYKKAVKQLVEREDEIAKLKHKILDLEEAEVYRDYSNALSVNGLLSTKLDNTIRTGREISGSWTSAFSTSELLKEIFYDRSQAECDMTWRCPIPLKWRNNTYEELNNALENASHRFAMWDEQQHEQEEPSS